MDELLEGFRARVAEDGRSGRMRSVESYQRLFPGHDELIADEYARAVESAPTPPRPVDPTGSTDSVLERLPRGDAGLEVEGDIAQGGMGAVERVRDAALHRDLARKVMLPENEADALAVHRFLEEAQVTAQLDHPGVVPVHQLGRDEDGRLYFTMKLVKGRTLSRIFELVRRGSGTWTLARAVELFIRICDTLAFAHEKGVVHRDLKPANIMVGDFGELYVMDWGLAKVLGARAEPTGEGTPAARSLVQTVRTADTSDDSPTATGAGYVLGTPAYMPLEQALGAELDARSDVYAVGAMLYELLAGHHPYADKGRSAQDVIVAIVAGPPAPVGALAPGTPGEIVAICEKAMARDPAGRYQTAGGLAEELRNFVEGRVVRAYRTGALVELKKWVWRNKALASAIGAAFLLLVVGLVASGVLYREAVAENERAQREAYRAAISAAAAQIENDDPTEAGARLEALPAHLRGWEWRHLQSRVDPSFATVPLHAVAFDARTNQLLGVRKDSGLRSYDLATGALTEVVPANELYDRRPGISPDGRYCLVRLDAETVGVRDLHTSKTVARTGGLFAPGRPWLVAEGRTIDLTTGREVPPDAAAAFVRRLREEGRGATSVSPDRTRVVLVVDHQATMVDVATGDPVGETIHLGNTTRGSAWSPDGSRVAVASWAPWVTLIDAATGNVDRRLPTGSVSRVAFSADGRLLVASNAEESRVWFLGDRANPRVLRGHTSYVYPVAFSRDGQRIASGGWDGYAGTPGSLRLWDAATGVEIARTNGKTVMWQVAFLAGGRLLTASSDRTGARIRDADTLEEIRRIEFTDSAAAHPDGTRFVAAVGTMLHVYDAAGEVLKKIPGRVARAVAFTERWIAAGTLHEGELAVGLWNARTYAREAVIPGALPVNALAVSPDGTRIVVAGGEPADTARVFDVATRDLVGELPGHGREVLCARFSPDGSRILVGGRDTNIHVWDAESYKEIVQLRGHESYVYALAFSPDGETLASSSGDGTVRIWETKPLVARQRAILLREELVKELEPRVEALFESLKDPKAVAARLRSDLAGGRREVALQLALAEAVDR